MPGRRSWRVDDVEPHLLEFDVASEEPHIGWVSLDAPPYDLCKAN